MKQWRRLFTAAGLMAVMTANTVYAAGWQWMDSDNDNVSQCYYVQDDGTVLVGTTTPDGYTVNEEGAWVVDGVVQTQEAQKQQTASIASRPAHVSKSSMKTSQVEKLRYVLYSPKNPTDNMALIVHLHGHGQGDNMDLLVKEIEYLREEADKKANAFILAPLLPPELDNGKRGMWPGIEASVMELVESVITTYNIDRSRVSIIGGSMGADSAIQIAAAHPDVFSCCVGIGAFHEKCPIARWEESWGEKLKNTPCWFFVEDESSAKALAQATSEGIKAAGGQAWAEILTGTTHYTLGRRMGNAMGESGYGIYDWMTSVVKTK